MLSPNLRSALGFSSVTTRKRSLWLNEARDSASANTNVCTKVSAVPPDFETATKRAVFTSVAAKISLNVAGSILSR